MLLPPSPPGGRPESQGAAKSALAAVNDAAGLHAALLALLVPAGSRRPALAWQVETAGNPQAPALRDEVIALAPAERLPWFEKLLVRMARQPLGERQWLIEAARRVVRARGAAWPIDTLRWLLMRQRLGEHGAVAGPAGADVSYSQLPEEAVYAIARYSAFLARLVPSATIDRNGHAGWYAAVMAPWLGRVPVPPCDPAPDADALVQALRQLQALPWLQRPVIARTWVSAALQHSSGGRMSLDAADALRMSCTLLDSPMPPELAAHYIQAPTP
ncbi:MAG: hypothetical protein AD742_17765 [Methylibium sp. NZG]|nr:MAG: hypothetical protein AD742_17765 [Methylibium sp. NZG]